MKLRAFVLLTFITLLPTFFYCQEKSIPEKIDKYLKLRAIAKTDKEKLRTYTELAWLYRKVSADSAERYSDSTIILAKKLNDKTRVWLGLNSKAHALGAKGELKESLSFHQQALNYAEANKDKLHEADSYQNIGIILRRMGDNKTAREYVFKARDVYQALRDTEGLQGVYITIGNQFSDEENYKEAINYFNECLRYSENSLSLKALALTNLGHTYYYSNEKQKAKNYYWQSLECRIKLGDPVNIADSYSNYGYMLYEEKNYIEANEYYEKALTLLKPSGNKDKLNTIYGYMSELELARQNYKAAFFYSDSATKYKDSIINEAKINSLSEMSKKFDSEKKRIEIEGLNKENAFKENENKSQKRIIYIVIVALLITIILGAGIYRQYKQNKKANNIIVQQKHALEEKQKEILDSINYARRIQYTLLAHHDFLVKNLPDHFVFFNPKDIVSGDFYWATKKDNRFYLAVCDSTGHGVPGAFMSLLNISFLNEAVTEKGIIKPCEVFDFVKQRLIDNVSKDGQKDGFDGILICIEPDKKVITYAAANNKPIQIRKNEFIELGCDRMPVGIGEKSNLFTHFTINYESGDLMYLYTDGYPDQFGGPKGKKFKYKTLNDLLLSVSEDSMQNQLTKIKHGFESWKGELEQVDDICLIGIKL